MFFSKIQIMINVCRKLINKLVLNYLCCTSFNSRHRGGSAISVLQNILKIDKGSFQTLNICCKAASPPADSISFCSSSTTSFSSRSQFFDWLCCTDFTGSLVGSRSVQRRPRSLFLSRSSILVERTLKDDSLGTISFSRSTDSSKSPSKFYIQKINNALDDEKIDEKLLLK